MCGRSGLKGALLRRIGKLGFSLIFINDSLSPDGLKNRSVSQVYMLNWGFYNSPTLNT